MSDRAGWRARVVVLTAAAALAAGGSVLWKHDGRATRGNTLPRPAGAWRTAAVEAMPGTADRVGACGLRLGPQLIGVRHPQLPCGVTLYLQRGATTILTSVVDAGPTGADAFELTPRLAALLGVHGRATVRWRFSG